MSFVLTLINDQSALCIKDMQCSNDLISYTKVLWLFTRSELSGTVSGILFTVMFFVEAIQGYKIYKSYIVTIIKVKICVHFI